MDGCLECIMETIFSHMDALTKLDRNVLETPDEEYILNAQLPRVGRGLLELEFFHSRADGQLCVLASINHLLSCDLVFTFQKSEDRL